MGKNNDDFFVKKKPWSEVKDGLLACYLKPYFSKVITTNRPIFYIDGFAGKGKFEENIESILENNKGKNIFMYIDPYGIKSLNFNVLTSVVSKEYNSVEFLLNLNSFGFIREVCNVMKVKFDLPELEFKDIVEQETVEYKQEQPDELLNRIAGGDY